jgi:hypothetical protein
MGVRTKLLLAVLIISGFNYKLVEAQEPAVEKGIDTSFVVVVMNKPDTVISSTDTSGIVDFHPQDSPQETGFLITTQDGKSQLLFRGSIRMNGAIDLNGLQNKENFQTLDIPVGDKNISETRFFLSARQTRFGMEAQKETNGGPIAMRIEGDFFGKENSLRLRHAYGSFRDYLVGQTWSVFGDPLALPWTVDFEGPNSSVLERTVQMRYSSTFGNKYRFTASLEAPSVDLIVPDSVQAAYQSIPDVIARIRKSGNNGHIQFAALIRNINVKTALGNKENLIGYGFLLSGRYNINAKNHLLMQFVNGQGIARYITALTGRGLDIVYNSANDEFETLNVYGGFISYGINWADHLFSYFTPGITGAINKPYQPDNAFRFSGYFSANIFWDIIEGLRFGGEYSYGSRINKNGEWGGANRFSFIVYYDF